VTALPVKKKKHRDYTPGKPSVTTVLGKHLGWKTQGLIGWAFRLGKEGRSMGERDEAAAKGSCAHDIVAAHYAPETHGDLSSWREEQLHEARPNAQRTIDEIARRGWTVLHVEVAMESESFAGTLDMVVRDADGFIAIVDHKTSKGAYNETVIQLGAYGWLWRLYCAGFVTDDVPATALFADRGYVMHAPYGEPLRVLPVSPAALMAGEQAFRLLLQLHEIEHQIKLGEALP
jgi:hypothetical protein